MNLDTRVIAGTYVLTRHSDNSVSARRIDDNVTLDVATATYTMSSTDVLPSLNASFAQADRNAQFMGGRGDEVLD